MLDAMAKNAARLCEADDAQILRIEGDVLRRAASFGSRQTAETRPVTREIVAGRAVIDRQTVHVHDIRAAEDQGFPGSAAFSVGESRTLLAVPLLREGNSLGTILIRRFQVRPFSDNQISLPTRRLLRLKTSGFSRSCRRGTVTSPKLWSSRPPRTKFCA